MNNQLQCFRYTIYFKKGKNTMQSCRKIRCTCCVMAKKNGYVKVSSSSLNGHDFDFEEIAKPHLELNFVRKIRIFFVKRAFHNYPKVGERLLKQHGYIID